MIGKKPLSNVQYPLPRGFAFFKYEDKEGNPKVEKGSYLGE